MTKAEHVVIDTLEHNALQWDATDPEQASAFRDAATVLRELADRQIVPVTAPPFPPTQEPVPEPVRTDEPPVVTSDPNDGAASNG